MGKSDRLHIFICVVGSLGRQVFGQHLRIKALVSVRNCRAILATGKPIQYGESDFEGDESNEKNRSVGRAGG